MLERRGGGLSAGKGRFGSASPGFLTACEQLTRLEVTSDGLHVR